MGLAYQDGLALTGVKTRLKGGRTGPTVAVLGEMDSVIVTGHPFADPVTHAAPACGHHAQVASMIGTGLGLQPLMAELAGDVVLFAVPAEEGIEVEYRLQLIESGQIEFIVGKAELIRIGAFDDIDMAIITHASDEPNGLASVGDSHNGCVIKHIRYTGKAAHGGDPQIGINALRAALLGLAGIDAQRDTFYERDLVRVHPIITRGGQAVSIIPDDVRIETFVRAKTIEAVQQVSEQVDRALIAGAMAIGATVDIRTIAGFLPHTQDPNLVRLSFENSAALVGRDNMGTARENTGSTDMGDVTQIMPAVHPRAGGTVGTAHTPEFVVEDHYLAAVMAAKSMAMTIIDLLSGDASVARGVLSSAGGKLSRQQYVDLRRSLSGHKRYAPPPAGVG
jgi:amidohydrolase